MNKYKKIIYLIFSLLPLIDLLTSIVTRFTNFIISPGIILKGLIVLFVIIYTFFFSKSKIKKISIIYLVSLFLFMGVYLLISINKIGISGILREGIYLFKYMYFPIMLVGCLNLFFDNNINSEDVKKILFINCCFYTLLILIPYFTNSGFSSYDHGGYGGYNGWFYAANETSAIMCILLISIYSILKHNSIIKTLCLFPIMLSISILGTKVSFFGMIIIVVLTCILYLIKSNDNKKKYLVFIFSLFLLFIASCYSHAMQNLSKRIENVPTTNIAPSGTKKNVIKDKPKENNDIKSDVITFNVEENKKITDLCEIITNDNMCRIIKIALSNRDTKLIEVMNLYNHGNLIDKFFGIGWIDKSETNEIIEVNLIEMDFLDILFHYGMVGLIVYILPLFLIILFAFKKMIIDIKNKHFNIEFLFQLLVLFLIFSISLIAGHVISAPAVSIYVVLLLILIVFNINNEELKENKIAILALHLDVGGTEKYISSLCKMLENDYDIEIISTYKKSEKPYFDFSDSIKIRYLINDYPRKQEFKEALQNNDVLNIIKYGYKLGKVLFFKYYYNNIVTSEINSKYVITTRHFHSRIINVNKKISQVLISTEHNYHNNDKRYIRKVINSVKNFEYFVVVSEELHNYYKDKVGKTKCIYIPNIIENILPYRNHTKINNKLVSVGRLEPEKGYLDLIDVISMLKKDIPNIKLDIYGDGSQKDEIIKRIKDNNLQSNVTLHGFVSQQKIYSKFEQYDLYVMTSYTESFGLVLIESMSNSVPCIAFDSASGARKILSNNCGVLIKDRNKSVMHKEIINLLNDIKLINKYNKKGYKNLIQYDINTIKKDWLKLLQRKL